MQRRPGSCKQGWPIPRTEGPTIDCDRGPLEACVVEEMGLLVAEPEPSDLEKAYRIIFLSLQQTWRNHLKTETGLDFGSKRGNVKRHSVFVTSAPRQDYKADTQLI